MRRFPYYVGLDIGTYKVRCVVGMLETTSTGSRVMNVIGAGNCLNLGMRKGNVVHFEDVARAIEEAVLETERMAGIKINAATINVNGAHIECQPSRGIVAISSQNHQISEEDRVRVEEAANLINLPANREIIQVYAKNYLIDGQGNIKDPIGMRGMRLEVDTLVVTASLPLLKSLDLALERANIMPRYHTVSGLAAAEAVLDRKQKESGAAVIDIGAGTTNLVIIEEGEVVYVAVIPIGSQNLTNDLAIGLKTDLDVADKVKITHTTLNFEKPPAESVSVEYQGKRYYFSEKMVRLVVEARMEELFEQIDRELKKVNKSRKLPGGVVLVGATADMPGIADFAREKLQLSAKKGKITDLGGLTENVNNSEYATVVGLMIMDMLLDGNQVAIKPYRESAGIVSGLFTKIKNFTK
ncbi:cell division protein FtsA [Candidatus Saccharibacteria bacterium]|nr:cell division protein FtsA [Candidatus Saccharibacteria bacterium]HPW47984.1 cell division protein FtsA [Candidatus Saccharibacteria bacterium]